MIYTVTSATPIKMIKDEMQAHAKEYKFGLLNTFAFKEILESKGFPIKKEIYLFELCNPLGAQQALLQIPSISVHLPCRISAYEEEGKTVLTTVDFEKVIKSIEADDELKALMSRLFADLKAIMHSWE